MVQRDDNGNASQSVIPEPVIRLLEDSRLLGKFVNCFDFVPSDYETVWGVLSEIRSRFSPEHMPSFCEWGSGLGVVTGMAELLGFLAAGIEIDAALAEQSRLFLQRHGLSAKIMTGSYLEIAHAADVIFVYCWPGRILETQRHFIDTASPSALLLICHGASDVRCMDRQGLIKDRLT